MHINKNISSRSGFTLIELLTVIAIIGILSAILIPTIGVVRKSASKATSASNLRQIALGYNAFANAGSRVRTIANGAWSAGSTQTANIQGWAHVVAEFGELNDAALYFIDSAADVALLPSIPQTILDDSNAATAAWDAAASAISYDAVTQISPNVRGVITPLIWTKGIGGTDSTWAATNPWEGEGGHIAFLDAHVVFYKDLTGELSDSTGAVQNNIAGALGTGPVIVGTPSSGGGTPSP